MEKSKLAAAVCPRAPAGLKAAEPPEAMLKQRGPGYILRNRHHNQPKNAVEAPRAAQSEVGIMGIVLPSAFVVLGAKCTISPLVAIPRLATPRDRVIGSLGLP